MCVCYQLDLPFKALAKTFKAKYSGDWTPKGSVRPGNDVPVVLVDPSTRERVIKLMTWGMPLFNFEKQHLEKFKLFNAKLETVSEKKTFKPHFLARRILVPVSPGFNEWQDVGEKIKKPYQIGLKTGEPFAFAGFWGKWNLPTDTEKAIAKKKEKDPDYDPPKKEYELFTFLTQEPNELMAKIHTRMPVILDPKLYDAWLDPDLKDPKILKTLIKPLEASHMVTQALD